MISGIFASKRNVCWCFDSTVSKKTAGRKFPAFKNRLGQFNGKLMRYMYEEYMSFGAQNQGLSINQKVSKGDKIE